MTGRSPVPEDLLALAPDPSLAASSLERVTADPVARRALADDPARAIAVRLLGFSRAAADLLARHPAEAYALADVSARDRTSLDAEVAADIQAYGTQAGLRRFRQRALMRTAARDLAGAPLEEVVSEISDVADACLAAAAQAAGAEELAVVALGKLGGRELNFASDVDLLFVHRDPGPEAQAAAQERANALMRLLSEPTVEGLALRIDPALRPGGRAGALSRSLEATLAYYERESATWERQAMLKARPAAGDLSLGAAFVEAMTPFVYPAHLAPAAIDEVRRTKVRLEEYIRQRGKELVEVKRGRGGIRDVEFAVQLLQIVHGRRDLRLRSPNTLTVLAALADEGYVGRADAEALADAYRFLRRLEHRLQIVRDLQTHDLPVDGVARTTLARSLGLDDQAELQREYDRTTGLVREIHERLFYRPLLEAFAGPAAPRPGLDRAATEELLEGLGFARPGLSYAVLARLVGAQTRLGKVLGHLFPVMAPALAFAAEPDAALVRLERIAEALGDRPGPADALAADPIAARRLAHVVGASRFATDLLVADPERIRALADGQGPTGDVAGELVRVVGRYASRELSPRDTGSALAAVADRILADAVERVAPDLPLAVIGLGKLGAREPSFASDLDVVFVYEGEGPADQHLANDLAESVMRHVRDAGWEIDAGLRPEGRNGPLARSLTGFLEYWERYAELWEVQALLRARPVAGDHALGRRFVSAAHDLAFRPGGISIDEIVQIRRMRERIERERVKPPEATKFHFKLGHGSLADVQFSVEMLLLRHGGDAPEVRTPQTLDAIERLAERRLVEQTVARELGEAFVTLTDVKDALEIDRRVHAEAVPASPEEQTALARRLGYEEYPRQAFIDHYLRVTRRCRRAMERVFAEAMA
jgi:glutamate-ammonia-ligase adenylyltransferase